MTKPQYFLAKTDPTTYSIDDFAKERSTVWNGVRNPQAVKALKAMRPGDKVLIYHSMGEATIRGLAVVEKNLGADPKDSKSWLVKLRLTKIYPEPYITLGMIKASGRFPDSPLVKQSRLSTMPVEVRLILWFKKQGLAL